MAKEKVTNQCAFDETSISLIGLSSTKYFYPTKRNSKPCWSNSWREFLFAIKTQIYQPRVLFQHWKSLDRIWGVLEFDVMG